MAAQGLAGFYGSVFKRSTTVGILVRNGDGRVLVLRTGSGGWNLPAGIVKSGEDPRSSARRLLRNVLGLESDVGRVLVLDYIQAGSAQPGASSQGTGDSITFLFDGGILDTTVETFTLAGGERVARFVPGAGAQTLDAAGSHLAAAGCEALELGTVTELVNGAPDSTVPDAVPRPSPMMPPLAGFSTILGR
ncbi:NUDIX hydrolase [Arthrobacter sp. zg-ZUI100]|uniref:NUDIX domain-containing protein n=1 Tax=Arthrobacter jiangjiafuii TaxID=2817475 RepID=UPI001AEE22F8|nr:NUDIX hydrolase [Arthrobacter jiangjiafuii]